LGESAFSSPFTCYLEMDHTLFQLHSSEMLAHSYLPLDYPSFTPDGLAELIYSPDGRTA